ncbi:MAG: proprotein convertase P-domain-containing protein [Planctomycetes bacterium]|nr:proprotein convertase P-domain-containing protein [Planctomycetota bacterium]MBI3835225.1 proprotein convertase P-domain-containing protein [Planctomycetota bacterium]
MSLSPPGGNSALARASIESIQQVRLESLDRASLLAEDEAREQAGLPLRFAVATTVSLRPQTDGTWESVGDGMMLWRLRISSTGANSINLGFSHFKLPKGAQLVISPATGGRKIGPFTEAGNNPRGQFWTPIVDGDDVVVEVTVSESARSALDLEISSINVAYRDFGTPTRTTLSGACNVDVACPEADPWRDQVNSVGLFSVNGTLICTGSMLNNSANDLRPLFLTANHCGINEGNAATVVVYWNYENSTCRTPGSPASGGSGDGSLSMFQSGATFRAGSANSDFTLVELDSPPNPAWDVFYAGWDYANQTTASAAGIHHPAAAEKRISLDDDPTQITSYIDTVVPGDGTHLRVLSWSLGTTEPGSSGSPLFNQDHRVVAQLHGGFTACGNTDSIWYGRLAISWNGEGTPGTRLSDWLDPLAIGATSLDQLSSGGMTVTPSGDVTHIGPVGGPFTFDSLDYHLTNATANPLHYQVSPTVGYGLLLNGSGSSVSGTLSPGGTDVITVSIGPDVDSLPAGVYVDQVKFSDLTNSRTRTRTHTTEIGQTLFSVSPSTELDSGGPAGGPFPDSALYMITNQRPSPVDVTVSGNASWISLNGTPGPLTISLNGNGDSQSVVVGFSSGANNLGVGQHSGMVTFTNAFGGAGDASRAVLLDVGRIVHTSTDTPIPINDFAIITSTITVPEAKCIGDLDVDMNITHTYIGDLLIDLESPTGTIVRLHNGTGGTTDNIYATYDDSTFPPDGPGALADFIGESSAGVWKLTVMDTGFPDSGTLNHWGLRIAPAAGMCPVSQLIYSFPLDSDPGWMRQGMWQYGIPSGGGSHNHDPLQGYTGAHVFGYNLNGDYPNNLAAPLYLTSNAIDCSSIAQTRLLFRRWLGVDSLSFDHASIDVSTNGTNWTNVWSNGDTIVDSNWLLQTYNISAVADGHATVFIRWGMGPTNVSNTFPGWNIDDVQIWGVPRPTTCMPSTPLGACCIAESAINESTGMAANRYISFIPGNPGRNTALRVKLISLHHPDPPNPLPNIPPDFSSFEGEYRWVGPPSTYQDSAVNNTHFIGAPLQCSPFFADWGSMGQIYVFGAEVVPDSIYEVQAVVEVCGTVDESLYSSDLSMSTGRWGDVIAPFQVPDPALLSQPNVSDITAIVDKFKDRPAALVKPRAQLQGNSVNPANALSISDVALSVDAFKGLVYPFSGPSTCGN